MLFICESHSAVTHTFIRNDISRISEVMEVNVIDIELVWKKRKFGLRFIYYVFKLLFLFIKNPETWGYLFSSRYKSNIKAFIITALLLEKNEFINKEDIYRAHFLGKAAIVASLLGRLSKSKIEIVCHASDLYMFPKTLIFILNWATKLEAINYFGKGFLFSLIGNRGTSKIFLNRNAIDIVDVNSKIKFLEKRNKIQMLSIARLSAQKDLLFIIDVVVEILKIAPKLEIEIQIIGEGPERAVINKSIKENNLTDHIKLLGSIDNNLIIPYFENCDGFILPCKFSDLNDADGLPVVFQESLFLGCPVFCRDSFGVSELIINNINGIVFNINDSAIIWASEILKNINSFDRSLITKIAIHQFKNISYKK